MLIGDIMSKNTDKNLINIYSDNMQISFAPNTFEKTKTKVENNNDEVIGKSKIIAIILALLFGRYGVHQFYLGKPAIGLLYLLFSRFEFIKFLSLCDVLFYLFIDEKNWLKLFGSKKFTREKKNKKI